MCSHQGLGNGSTLKVLWATYDGSQRKSSTWFTATVCEIQEAGPDESPVVRMKLSYAPQLNFPHTIQRVELLPDKQLIDVVSKEKFGWVLHETESLFATRSDLEEEETDVQGEDDQHDKTYKPENEDWRNPSIESQRNVQLLRLRMDKIEKEVSAQRVMLRNLRKENGSVQDTAHRPILFLQQKLETMFSKPISNSQGKVTNDKVHQSMPRIYQSSLQCSVDCTLKEFDSICAMIQHRTDLQGYFDPPFDQRYSSDDSTSQLCISFPTLTTFCAALGKVSMTSMKELVLRKKMKKGSNTSKKLQTTYIRILGCLERSKDNSNDPAVITVGGTYSPETAELLDRAIPVLYREHNTWNSVEKRFCFPLQVLEMSGPQLASICHGQPPTSGTESGKSQNQDRPMFRLQWKRISKAPIPALFSKADSRESDVGTLEAVLPYVLMQGKQLCREMEKLLRSYPLGNFLK